MPTKNKARKSTGTRASSSTASPSSSNRSLRQRGSNQASTSAAQRDSSGSDDEEPTIRISNGRTTRRRIQAPESSSDTTSDSDQGPGRITATPKKNERKTKRKIARRRSSEEDSIPSSSTSVAHQNATSSNQTVASPNKTTLEPRNFSNLVNKCIYYLLIADQKKCLIKKTDIQKHVFTQPERPSYSKVITEAGTILKKTYGMELVVSTKRAGEYMLINILNHNLGVQEFIEYSSEELQKRGFIFYLLTIIFMNENSISDAELTSALKPLGIDLNGRNPHPIFGDVPKYLKELASQQYIERIETSKDPPQYELIWGERAHMEVAKKDLLEFACQIMGDVKPEDWILQHNDAMSSRQDSP